MFKYILPIFITLVPANQALAVEISDLDSTINSFLSGFTECKVNSKVTEFYPVSKRNGEIPSGVPQILPTDLEVKADTVICDNKDKYYFWLRKGKEGYTVVSYTSVNQPE